MQFYEQHEARSRTLTAMGKCTAAQAPPGGALSTSRSQPCTSCCRPLGEASCLASFPLALSFLLSTGRVGSRALSFHGFRSYESMESARGGQPPIILSSGLLSVLLSLFASNPPFPPHPFLSGTALGVGCCPYYCTCNAGTDSLHHTVG